MSNSPPTLPSDAITLTQYGQLDEYLRTFADGDFDLVLIIGRAGTGKSEAVKTVLGLNEDSSKKSVCKYGTPLYVEGHIGTFGLYRQLYAHRHCPIVIDDLDKLYTRSDCVRLLKPLCNNTPVKRVTWFSNTTINSPDIPESFLTRSRVILIANEWQTLNQNVRALEDRAIIIHFAPSNMAVHQHVRHWFDDDEVYGLLESVVPVAPSVSMRHYVKARSLKLAGISDWEHTALQMVLGDVALSLVAYLKNVTTFKSENERISRFTEITGRSRPTYFRLKKKLEVRADVPI